MPGPIEVNVYLLPALVEPQALSACAVVVIDVLRATTTIVTALASGAADVVPCQEVDDAWALKRESHGGILLGGERGGRQIAGFDLGNSPAEYTRERVAGKMVAFTTTNGTRAMKHCLAARRVLIGAFVNYSAICRELSGEERVAILCAGTDGQVTREDALLAGAIVDDLARAEGSCKLNDQAELAADAWRTAVRLMIDRPLGLTLRDSLGGRNLMEIGHESDIDLAAQLDRFDIVPQLDLAAWRIRVA